MKRSSQRAMFSTVRRKPADEDAESTDGWLTPPDIIEIVERLAPIALDPCSSPTSIVPARVRLMVENGDDGLAADWRELADGGLVYVNWPYSVSEAWALKCLAESQRGGLEIVALPPARIGSGWFDTYCLPPDCQAVSFLPGRQKFLDPETGIPRAGAPFGSALVYWGTRPYAFARAVGRRGKTWRA